MWNAGPTQVAWKAFEGLIRRIEQYFRAPIEVYAGMSIIGAGIQQRL
jgi:hypothetical protein